VPRRGLKGRAPLVVADHLRSLTTSDSPAITRVVNEFSGRQSGRSPCRCVKKKITRNRSHAPLPPLPRGRRPAAAGQTFWSQGEISWLLFSDPPFSPISHTNRANASLVPSLQGPNLHRPADLFEELCSAPTCPYSPPPPPYARTPSVVKQTGQATPETLLPGIACSCSTGRPARKTGRRGRQSRCAARLPGCRSIVRRIWPAFG